MQVTVLGINSKEKRTYSPVPFLSLTHSVIVRVIATDLELDWTLKIIRSDFHLFLKNEETEAQRAYMTSPKLYRLKCDKFGRLILVLIPVLFSLYLEQSLH